MQLRPDGRRPRRRPGNGMVSGAVSARCSAIQPSSPASDAVAGPQHLAGRWSARRASPACTRRSGPAASATPARTPGPARRPAVRPPEAGRRCRAARRRRAATPIPFQAGRNRASACFSTGSTSARNAASDRRRSSRSTSASTNSGHRRSPRFPDDPSGRNSPSASRPEPASRRSASVTTATPRPNRDAGSAATNGPCVRAYRPSSRPSGSSTDASSDSAMPGGSAVPSASRRIARVGGVGPQHLAADPHLDRPPARGQLGQHRRRRRPPTAQVDLGGRQRPENPEQVGDLVDVAGPAVLGDAL